MLQKAVSVCVSFATENFIAIDTESVEEILFFRFGFLNESRECSLKCLKFSRMNFEVWMETNKIRNRIHLDSLHFSILPVETILMLKYRRSWTRSVIFQF